MPWSVETIIQSGGLLAIFLIIFSESGLFFGVLFPGDSLLLAAGFLAGQDIISIYWLIPVVIVAAILGDNVGYYIGRRLGPRVFRRDDGLLFRREYLEKTHKFYKRHGGKTIIIARFIAVVRTFAPVIAGVAGMTWKRFAFFNVVGAIIWGAGLPLAGRLCHRQRFSRHRQILPLVLVHQRSAVSDFRALADFKGSESPIPSTNRATPGLEPLLRQRQLILTRAVA
jgi:membrane-associated protein